MQTERKPDETVLARLREHNFFNNYTAFVAQLFQLITPLSCLFSYSPAVKRQLNKT
jgi:hypothetical protein